MTTQDILIVSALFIAYFFAHSLIAGQRPKAILSKAIDHRVVNGFYRVFYNIFAVISLLPVALLVIRIESKIVYVLPGFLAYIFIGIQAVGLIGAGLSLLFTDIWNFVGISQILAYARGLPEATSEVELQTKGPYRFVRHPLYFFSILLIWFTPTMTDVQLLVNSWLTVYIVVGSLVEERRMLKAFGQAYAVYQEEVPALLPIKLIRKS